MADATLAAADAETFSAHGQRISRLIETCGKPVLACVRGFALGGGCELAMACTLRIAAEDAPASASRRSKLGVVAGYGGTQRLPRLVGRGAALKLLLTGAIIDAHEALRIGLVDEVVPAADLMQRAEALALEIAANAPLAIAETLRTVDEGLDLPLDAALAREAAVSPGSFLWIKTGDAKDLISSLAIDPAPLRWIGVENQFFAMLLTPATDNSIVKGQFHCYNHWDDNGRVAPAGADPDIEAEANFAGVTVPAGKSVTMNYGLYAGPKDFNRLDALGANQGELMNYGWFELADRADADGAPFLVPGFPQLRRGHHPADADDQGRSRGRCRALPTGPARRCRPSHRS